MFDAFVAALTGALPGNFGTFNIGSDTPSAANRDKLWYKVDSSCNPLGWFIYSGGAWVRATPIGTPPGMVAHFFLSTFDGNLARDRARISFIDTGETYPGSPSIVLHTNPFWLLCDGVASGGPGGTPPDLQGRTLVAGGAGASLTVRVYDATGGEELHTLGAAELAPHQHEIPEGCEPGQSAASAVIFDRFGSVANHPAAVQRVATAAPATGTIWPLTSEYPTVAAVGHNTMQPFRVGYAAIRTARTI